MEKKKSQKKIRNRGLKTGLLTYGTRRVVSQKSEIEEVGDSKNSLGNFNFNKEAKKHHPASVKWKKT